MKQADKGLSEPHTGTLTSLQAMNDIKSILGVENNEKCVDIVKSLMLFVWLERDYSRIDREQDEDQFLMKYDELYKSLIHDFGNHPTADHLYLELSISIRESILRMINA
jgi:hypothetical protein